MPGILGLIGRHGTWILLTMVLGSLLSIAPPLRHAVIGSHGLTASDLSRLIVYGFALVLVWSLSRRITERLPDDGKGRSFLKGTLSPLTTFLLILFAFHVLFLPDPSVLGHAGSRIYRLLYVVGLVGSATWVTLAWVRKSKALVQCLVAPGSQQGRSALREPSQTRRQEGPPTDTAANTEADRTLVLQKASATRKMGRYTVVKELARGSMGIVYLGSDPTLRRSVAIKTMRLDQDLDPAELQAFKERFFREAESTARLSHPHIVTIYDAGEEENVGYLAMELVEGMTLEAMCKKDKRLSTPQVLEIGATVADALDYAHRQGVVHRDIKPSNIMLTQGNTIKVMDFGIARINASTRTQTSVILGTPSYMSPEQIAGNKVDGRSDIFSLGVVLYELLTGHRPFTASNLSALLFAIAHTPPPRARTLCPDLPSQVEMILDRSLEKGMAQRYQRAGDLARDLRSCLQTSPA